MRVIDGAAEFARGVVPEHAPGHVAAAGAAEHRAAVQRGVAVKLAVVHVSGGALQMAHLFVTPEKRLAAILLLPFAGWQSSNNAMCFCVNQNCMSSYQWQYTFVCQDLTSETHCCWHPKITLGA